ncbi:Concanavalin A-like lectin/glucanase, subgroup [Cynara cardunculus var. scolymus]|uniref:Concanavalin A-like lectin/glucanase, subgroup n=1 Tax=Cynara cardunculus var. scolymus TaxID=59895 RepID=A0A103W848_CYNCS|nr:Concanavalin A-like lectin/glucanase, subgroup [Cynara cardunculus var. scolymus]
MTLTLLPILFLFFFQLSSPQSLPSNTTGYACNSNQTAPSCQTYVFFQAMGPNQLDLASIGDLFNVSRPTIAKPSNLTSLTSPLSPNQPLFIPVTCSCNSVNTTTNLSYAKLNYTIQAGDTFYIVSTALFHNLTTYQAVEIVNPTLVPTNLTIGEDVIFPIFCKCPTDTQLQNQVRYLISYVFQPSDTIAAIASRFGVTVNSIVEANGDGIRPSETVFVPVSQLPVLTQPAPTVNTSVGGRSDRRRGEVIGLGIGVGICGVLLILMGGLLAYRESWWKKRAGKNKYADAESKKLDKVGESLMADVSDCLDKYEVYKIQDLKEATDGFDERRLMGGSVYKGCLHGKQYAIKKMKWNAYPEDANCYLVYEYLENGSLYTQLHQSKKEKLSWKTRLRIAVDVANGLQYIHEHTRPRVVHKDVKSGNILLDANMRAKIANFGLAKSGCNAITMHIVGTQGYIAPEYLSDGVVSTKMDVFSFGVVLLELISGREAVDDNGKALWVEAYEIFNGIEDKYKYKLGDFMDDVLLKESCSIDSVMNVMSIAIACLHKDPSRRPSTVDIVYALCKSDDLFYDLSEDGLSPRQVLAR